MSLEGIRAWIGEVERKLRTRTKVFLALAAIAIGIAGAGIFLSIDTRSDAVSEGDMQTLQRDLEARMGVAGGVDATQVETLQAEIDALRDEVEQLQGGNGSGSGNGNGSGNSNGNGNGNGSDGGTSPGGGAGSGGAPTPSPFPGLPPATR